jgi:hypothetical protein
LQIREAGGEALDHMEQLAMKWLKFFGENQLRATAYYMMVATARLQENGRQNPAGMAAGV